MLIGRNNIYAGRRFSCAQLSPVSSVIRVLNSTWLFLLGVNPGIVCD